MKSNLYMIIYISFFSIFLLGCWDQMLLKDVSLIKAQAFDVGSEENLIKTTVSIIKTDSNDKIPTESVNISAEGTSIRKSRGELDKMVGSELYASKNRVTLVSSELAERDMYALLDTNLRSPLSALGAKLAITDKKSGSVLDAKPESSPLISDYLHDLLVSEEQMGTIPVADLQSTFKLLYDDGKDVILPRVKVLDNMSGVEITGTALFNNNQMTGTLSTEQTSLLLLLSNEKNGVHRFTKKVHSFGSSGLYDYLTADVLKSKRSLSITQPENSSDLVDIKIELSLKLNVIEYPANSLYEEKKINSLDDTLSHLLTKEANETLEILKKSNCDFLGIGRHLNAKFNSYWGDIDWKDVYPNVQIQAKVITEIETHGIIN